MAACRAHRALAALAAFAAWPAASEALIPWPDPQLEHPVTVSVGLGYDHNVNRARDRPERLGDVVFSFGASQLRHWSLGTNTRLQAVALVLGEAFEEVRGLSRLGLGAEAELQYRSSGAFDAVTLGLLVRALHFEHDSRLRTGARYLAALTARRAITDRIEVSAEVAASLRHGRSDVFNNRDHGLKLNVDYALGRWTTLYAGGEFRRGDIVSSGGASLVDVDIAEVFVPDDAFGPRDFFAYRFEGRTVLATLGFNRAFGSREALDISWRWVRSTPRERPGFEVGGPLRYESHTLLATYLIRF